MITNKDEKTKKLPEPKRPVDFQGLIESYLRNSRVEERDVKPLIKEILEKPLRYIPSFNVKLSELEEEHIKKFREKPITFLQDFRKGLLDRLNFEPEIKEIIEKYNISENELSIIPELEKGFSYIPTVKDLSLDLTRYVGKIVRFHGKNLSIGLERSIEYKKMVYKCLICGSQFEMIDHDHKIGEKYKPPKFCVNIRCKAKNTSDFRLLDEECESYEIRKFFINDLDNEKGSKEFKCVIVRNIEESIIKAKDLDIESPIEITGLLHIDNADLYRYQKSEQDFPYWIEVIDFKPKEIRAVDQEIVKKLKKNLAGENDFLFELIDSVQPYSKGIYDYFPVKVLNCLSIITADSWDRERNIRNTLNSIIGGHRGTLKTSLAKYIQSILRINNFGLISGKNTTEKGLIPTVQRNNQEKNLIKRYGALRYYNRKTLTFDEAQYLAIAVLEILKCLEDGEITRGLDGSIINAETKLTVILLLNYKTEDEAFDYSKTLIENLGFPKDQLSILDRFDLHYAIPKLSIKVRKILKRRNYKPVTNYVSKDCIYNWLLEAKRIYTNGVKIPLEIYNLIDDFDDVICLNRPEHTTTSPREFIILLKLLKSISALKLKEEVDDSDIDFLKKHLLTTIIPYQNNAFVSKQRIIDMEFVFKNTFSLLTELFPTFALEEHIKFIREFLENNYFQKGNKKNNTGRIDMDEILVAGVSLKELELDDYMPKGSNLQNNKYRNLFNNSEIIAYIENKGYFKGKISNKTHFINIDLFMENIKEIFQETKNKTLDLDGITTILEFNYDFDKESSQKAIDILIAKKRLAKLENNIIELL